MELGDFKSDYKNAGKGQLNKDSIQQLIHTHNNPVVRGIKIQLIIESVLWALFLVVYYDFFDGHLKPLLWNILLLVSVLLILLHNLLGYQISKNPINGTSILESLEKYLNRIRKYSTISIVSRVLAIAMLLGYFFSSIEFTEAKYWYLLPLILIFPVQVYLLQKVWSKRIRKINGVYQKLKG